MPMTAKAGRATYLLRKNRAILLMRFSRPDTPNPLSVVPNPVLATG